MFKKTMILLLTIVMIFSTVGCNSTSKIVSESNDNWKIGIVTGTVIQNEEPYRSAEQVLAKYGVEHVIVQTYPDKYLEEQETVISNIVGLAANPDVKAIIVFPAIEGTLAAFEKARELRDDDILLILGSASEEIERTSQISDFCLQTDETSAKNTTNKQNNEGNFPSALGIENPKDKEGDVEWIKSEMRKKIDENISTGGFSVWPVHIGMTFIRASSDYAVKWINGEITEKSNMKALEKCFLDDTGVEITLTPLEQDGVKYDNYFICSYKNNK